MATVNKNNNKKTTKGGSSVVRKKKADPKFARGAIHIHSTYNNTIVTITTEAGDVLAWSSAGAIGYTGTKKKQQFSAQKACEAAVDKAIALGMKEVRVFVKGAGNGRDSVIKVIASKGLKILELNDVTPIPHNGCRPEKRARK